MANIMVEPVKVAHADAVPSAIASATSNVPSTDKKTSKDTSRIADSASNVIRTDKKTSKESSGKNSMTSNVETASTETSTRSATGKVTNKINKTTTAISNASTDKKTSEETSGKSSMASSNDNKSSNTTVTNSSTNKAITTTVKVEKSVNKNTTTIASAKTTLKPLPNLLFPGQKFFDNGIKPRLQKITEYRVVKEPTKVDPPTPVERAVIEKKKGNQVRPNVKAVKDQQRQNRKINREHIRAKTAIHRQPEIKQQDRQLAQDTASSVEAKPTPKPTPKPAPVESTPAPVETIPAPVESNPAPVELNPAQVEFAKVSARRLVRARNTHASKQSNDAFGRRWSFERPVSVTSPEPRYIRRPNTPEEVEMRQEAEDMIKRKRAEFESQYPVPNPCSSPNNIAIKRPRLG